MKRGEMVWKAGPLYALATHATTLFPHFLTTSAFHLHLYFKILILKDSSVLLIWLLYTLVHRSVPSPRFILQTR
jgi:hypothetical protein